MKVAGFSALAAALAAALALGACAPHQPRTPPLDPTIDAPRTGDGACNAARFGHWIGRKESELDLSTAPRLHRIICADCAMTMDYSSERLTIFLDADRKVARLACQ